MTRTTCPYCGVGCGVLVVDGIPRGDPDHPANFGRLCSKGAALKDTLALPDRLTMPMVHGREVSWDVALDHIAAEFERIRTEHGPEAIAFYVSGQFLTEDYYVANKLMKGFIGSANIDTNSRLCMASSVAGHVRAFGEDVVPGCYDDLEEADLVVQVGSNMAWCHPVLNQRLMAARERRGTRIVTLDPRRTATAETADLHLALAPGSDVIVWSGLLAWLANHDGLDRDWIARHVSGFEECLAAARRAAPSLGLVAAAAQLNTDGLRAFYELFARTERVVTLYSQGVNQSVSGTDKVNAIINCHLATGRIGRAGMGPFSLTGQPNAMGGREVGGLGEPFGGPYGFRAREYRTSAPFLESSRDRYEAWPQSCRSVRSRGRWPRQGGVDRRHQSGGFHAARRTCARRSGQMPAGDRRRRLAHRHDKAGSYPAACCQLGGERRHRHQFRTPHFPPTRVPRRARPGAARLVDVCGSRPAHGLARGILL